MKGSTNAKAKLGKKLLRRHKVGGNDGIRFSLYYEELSKRPRARLLGNHRSLSQRYRAIHNRARHVLDKALDWIGSW